MKFHIIIVISVLFLTPKHCYSSDSTKCKDQSLSFIGIYKSGRELLGIEKNNIFWVIRLPQKNDVVVAECNDTIAKGTWLISQSGVLLLSNSDGYGNVKFDVKAENKRSDDSVYVEIILPKSDAFFYGRFEYELFFWYGIKDFKSTNNFIALPKKLASSDSSYKFSLVLQDEYPNCKEGQKCYQRIFFTISDGFDFAPGSNYLTIRLNNFTECFVERMDINNEVLIFKNDCIYWRGNAYKRIVN